MSNENKEFSGKVALITGASSGIGAATAIHLSSLGASVAITGRNLENLQKVGEKCAQESNIKPFLIQADLSNEEDVRKIIESTIKTFGKLDILVNNAGISEIGSIENANLQQFDRIFTTNVRAVFQLTNLAVPHLIATKGNIVNISSLAGIRAFSEALVYSMSKSALDQFTKCISLELAPKQVRVNSINPGVIITNILSRSGFTSTQVNEIYKYSETVTPLGRIGQALEVADLVAFLASDKAGFITGAIMPIDGGRQNACPR